MHEVRPLNGRVIASLQITLERPTSCMRLPVALEVPALGKRHVAAFEVALERFLTRMGPLVGQEITSLAARVRAPPSKIAHELFLLLPEDHDVTTITVRVECAWRGGACDASRADY